MTAFIWVQLLSNRDFTLFLKTIIEFIREIKMTLHLKKKALS